MCKITKNQLCGIRILSVIGILAGICIGIYYIENNSVLIGIILMAFIAFAASYCINVHRDEEQQGAEAGDVVIPQEPQIIFNMPATTN